MKITAIDCDEDGEVVGKKTHVKILDIDGFNFPEIFKKYGEEIGREYYENQNAIEFAGYDIDRNGRKYYIVVGNEETLYVDTIITREVFSSIMKKIRKSGKLLHRIIEKHNGIVGEGKKKKCTEKGFYKSKEVKSTVHIYKI